MLKNRPFMILGNLDTPAKSNFCRRHFDYHFSTNLKKLEDKSKELITQILLSHCSQDVWRIITIALQLSTLSWNGRPYSKANLPTLLPNLKLKHLKAFCCLLKNKVNWINGRCMILLQRILFTFFYLILVVCAI